MQNELIAAISSIVTEGIGQEIGNSWYTIKVDGTKDPTGVESISMIIRFFNELSLKVAESSSTNSGDAKSITDVILAELTKAGLTSSKILRQVYDDASVMARHCGGVQRLGTRKQKDSFCALLEPSIAPVVMHAMSVEQVINDYLHTQFLQFFASLQLHFTIMVKS